MTDAEKTLAREAFSRADALQAEVLTRWPQAWQQMDQFRADPPGPWPEWCLLPMAASVAVTSGGGPASPMLPIAAVSALDAWRYSRSVWVVEPELMSRLLRTVPDTPRLGAFLGLPEWCVYLAGGHPEWPGSGLWVHLEADFNTGRPELRLLLDTGEGGLGRMIPVPVYLDRPTLTEALGDFRATAAASLGRSGADVRGGVLDRQVADLADRVDGLVALVAHLASGRAVVESVARPGSVPVRPRRPMRDRQVWRVTA